MNFNIDIADTGLANLSEEAKSKLRQCAKEYISDLLSEAARIEEGDRQAGASSEITSSNIMKAASVKRNRNTVEKKTPVWVKICKYISTISCLITGFLFDPTGYSDNLVRLVSFIICLAVACFSTACMLLKEK